MKTIFFALTLSLGFGAASSAFACDCEHKKAEKSCKGNCDPKNCGGSCNGAQGQDAAKSDKTPKK